MSYVLAEGQPGGRAVYYTGKEDFHGGQLWGNINDAYRFETVDAAFEQLKKNNCIWAGNIIKEIPDCTWTVIEKGYEDYRNNRQSTDRDVFHKFNTVSYITNSRKEGE